MGNFNREYENYYKKANGQKFNNETHSNRVHSDDSKSYSDDGIERLLGERHKNQENNKILVIEQFISALTICTVGVVILCVGLFIARESQQGREIYSYLKNVCSINFYYKNEAKYTFNEVVNNPKNYSRVSSNGGGEIESENDIKPFDELNITMKSREEVLMDSSVSPLLGAYVYEKININDNEDGMVFRAEDRSVGAILDGTIELIGKSDVYGDFIVVDHGENIKTKYLNLEEVSKSVGDSIGQLEIIGKYIDEDKSKVDGVIVQVFIDGQCKNPEDYIKFK